MHEVNDHLAELWGSKIEEYEINLAANTIRLLLAVCDSTGVTKTEVKFLGVRMVCFGNDMPERKLESLYMECTSIEVRELDIVTLEISFHTVEEKGHLIHPNVVIELDNGVEFLAILADKLVIDGAEYALWNE